MRLSLLLLCTASLGCAPEVEPENLLGFWGRIDDGNHRVWEFAEQIDATALSDVRPAFQRYEYPVEETGVAVASGRWNIFSGELVLTPVWSLQEDEINRTQTLIVDDFSEREISLLFPGDDEPIVFVALQALPTPIE
ncbi:MAG: hypothetical protein AB8H79_03015 [Myxococcota bacterium]